MDLIDLRSDTVTRPDAGMRAAMAAAEVGDDVYGEDPTVRALEERLAGMLGKEAGLFVPSGTMANQIAIGLQVLPGDEVIAEASSHCVNFEGGALSALWGAQPRPLTGVRGTFTAEQLAAAVRPDNVHYPRSRLVCLENTHNRGGGSVWPLEQAREVCAAARERGLAVHLDGARLFNAQAASGTPARAWAELADTVSTCLSKGLGAPAGSVLCGTRAAVAQARRLRKRLGGGMRQAGVLAAAGLYALEHNLPRLAEDHQKARLLAERLAALRGVEVAPEAVETNMVFARFAQGAAKAVAALRAEGILCNPEGGDPAAVRFVTHLDVSAAQVEEAARRAARAI